MAYQFTFEPIAANWPLLVQGAALTLALTAVSATVGLAVGILGAVSREWRLPFLHPFFTAYVECVRNTPFIVQLYFIYFGLPALGVRLNGWEASVRWQWSSTLAHIRPRSSVLVWRLCPEA